VELLIVDVDFAYPGLHTLTGLGLERHFCLLFFDGITLRHNVCAGDVGRKLEGWFLGTTLPMQVVTLGAPMCRNWNGIAIAPEMEESRIHGRNTLLRLRN
jgi:hypothetical protein